MRLSNQEALSLLKNHKNFQDFLDNLNYKKYPNLTLEKIFFFISSGVLIENMPLDETRNLIRDIKSWLNLHRRGGLREGAGRPKKSKNIVKITLSAEESSIKKAKENAKRKGSSLQALFRNWLNEINKTK
jgi:hypothetical protein